MTASIALAMLLVASSHQPGYANPTCHYHYAGQQTTTTSSTTSAACTSNPSLYYGWVGVNGRISAPITQISLANPTADHVNGALGITFSGIPDVQIGWFKGRIYLGAPPSYCVQPSCVSSTTQYGMYIEWRTNSVYNVRSYGGVAAELGLVYRVNQNGAWRVYDYYNNLLQTVNGLPNSGAPGAWLEHFRYSLSTAVPGSAAVDFGASNPNTNDALRIMGANGYEPWDTSLLSGGTERFYDAGETTRINYVSNHYFGAWLDG